MKAKVKYYIEIICTLRAHDKSENLKVGSGSVL